MILYLLAISTLSLSMLVVLLFTRYKKAVSDLNEYKMTPRKQSEELSDFLRDQKDYGFSFVRVEPSSVMIRSPRGH